ncbi:MAG: hypothetical protein IT382_00535, partial [Deltaproteobacteria bacterium]|nr:hypothetical protein [Deltaproteobacteria bacterium]
ATLAALLVSVAATVAACVPQSQTCADYVACQVAYDASVDTSPWEPAGSCWTSPQQAAACDDQCEEALAALQELPELPEECAPR